MMLQSLDLSVTLQGKRKLASGANFSVVNLADLNINIIREYAGEPKLVT